MQQKNQKITKKNPNEAKKIYCKQCNKTKEHHAKGFCYNCYKKVGWNQKKITCANCKKRRHHKALKLCAGCHTRLYNYDRVLKSNIKRNFKISVENYQNITRKCDSCGFDKVVKIHRLDMNKNNNNLQNLVGLCPNCHRMIRTLKYHDEIQTILDGKGFNFKDNFKYKTQ